jgi:hypothetical protein
MDEEPLPGRQASCNRRVPRRVTAGVASRAGPVVNMIWAETPARLVRPRRPGPFDDRRVIGCAQPIE